MKIKSAYATLDVTGKGRHKLAKHFKARPGLGGCPPHLRIPVVITGYIDGQFGGDDGTSIEFNVIVENVEVLK